MIHAHEHHPEHKNHCDQGHEHAHGHGDHDHHHAPKDFGRAFLIGISLNVAFVLIETAYGFWANSAALLADAVHNLSDVLGLAVAWAGAFVATRQPTALYTQGFGRASILAALFNSILLLVTSAGILYEATLRFLHPEPVAGMTVIVVAAIGILINGVTAWLFSSGHSDINIRGAYLHMLADAAVSLGVVLAGLFILWSGQNWIDPLVSIVIVMVILWSVWGVMKEAIRLSLDAVPAFVSIEDVRSYLEGQPGVTQVVDLRIWGLSTIGAALSVRLMMPGGHPGDAFLREVAKELDDHYAIQHAALQIEICQN